MASQLIRSKSNGMSACVSEVAHLVGVGTYASDAWRLFCKQPFYSRHGISVADEWRNLQPTDKDLRGYIQRKKYEEKYEERIRLLEEDLALRLDAVSLSDTPSEVVVGSGDNVLHVPRRNIREAVVASNGRADRTRLTAVVATAS